MPASMSTSVPEKTTTSGMRRYAFFTKTLHKPLKGNVLLKKTKHVLKGDAAGEEGAVLF